MEQATPVDAPKDHEALVAEVDAVEVDGSSDKPDAPVESKPQEPSYAEELKKKNAENQSLRQREKQALKTLTEKEALLSATTEKLSSTESRIAELESQLLEVQLNAKVIELASDSKVAAKRPAALVKLIDRDALALEDGEVQGIDKEVQRIKKEFPELFIQGSIDGGAGGSESPDASDMNNILRRFISR